MPVVTPAIDRAFVRMRYGVTMQVNTEREIETTLYRGVDVRF